MAPITDVIKKPSKIFYALVLIFIACGGSPVDTSDLNTPVVLSLRVSMASSDLGLGKNRLVFALLDSHSSPIRASRVQVALSHIEGEMPIARGNVEATFRPWPEGPGGVFTTMVNFTRDGTWLAEIAPTDGSAAGSIARVTFIVKKRSTTPSIGEPAPRSSNKTAADVSTLAEITSDVHPDPALYQMTIAEALETGRPLLVTFATPGFCTSATCGPQVEVVKALRETYSGRINFIHVEVYENPNKMIGNINEAKLSPEIEEWGLPTEPWTFIIDGAGYVVDKFEAFVSYEEIDEALPKLLQN